MRDGINWEYGVDVEPVAGDLLRQVVGEQNLYKGVAAKALEDPGSNCRLS